MINNALHYKARCTLKAIKQKQTIINSTNNLLSYRMHMFNQDYISSLKPCFSMVPQKKTILAHKKIIDSVNESPKYLVNEPCIKRDKEKGLVFISLKLVSLTNKINKAKNAFKKEDFIFEGISPLLTTYQLSIVVDLTNEFNYKIIMHQYYFEKNKCNFLFLGRIELGKTHLKNKSVDDPVFHIHIPSDETVTCKKQNELINLIYHCEPTIFRGFNQTPLSTALNVAMHKFNIVNDLESKLDFGLKKNCNFLKSDIGRDWINQAVEKKGKPASNSKIYSILRNEKQDHSISNWIYDTI